MSLRHTVPQVLYNTPSPDQPSAQSELYLIQAVVLDTATDPVKRWVVQEEHGYWDDQQRAFKNHYTTFLPNDPTLCVSLDEVHEMVKKQVMVRVQSGFKYQMEWDPYRTTPPYFSKFEIQPDGTRKEYS
jgi:hypothetical protein